MKLATHLACALLGAALTWWLLRDVPAAETAAPRVDLPSGAVVAERIPDAPLPPVAAEAARELGGTVARAGSVVVEPRPATADVVEPDRPGGAPQCLCRLDPLRLDWTLTNVADGQRMSWYTDSGTILSATDIPVAPVRMRRDRRWAAGVSVSVDMSQRRAAGVWVDRDIARLRLGLELSQRDGGTATLRAGIRF